MSGIVGIVNTDEPVQRPLLERMTAFLAFRGPDRQEVWTSGRVGFGHALLAISEDVDEERQPLTLDGQVWITADARLDDRTRLVAELRDAGPAPAAGATDAELILRAYLAWGSRCAEHLLGDFSFAVWDERRQMLLGVRDQIGVKPFFYAELPSGLVFSNTLTCVRQHPGVPGTLNDLAVADFLLFGYNTELDSTAFAGIRRLPGAHVLEWTPRGTTVRRYWSMPLREPVRFRRDADYIDRFNELLATAVSDRMRTTRVAVSMSGGLDSSTVATVAHELLAKAGNASSLKVWTTVSDSGKDEERRYATLVAEQLRVPISYQVVEHYKALGLVGHRMATPPEPRTLFGAPRQFARLTEVSEHGRIMFTGQGGDVMLHPSASYLPWVVTHFEFAQLARDVRRHYQTYGRLPRLGIRGRMRHWFNSNDSRPPFPRWLQPELVDRLDLRSRFDAVYSRRTALPNHHRPESYLLVGGEQWPRLFEGYDAEVTGFPIEFRHPFFDLRLLDFTLTIPTMPWCIDKALVREAMRGRLPEAVRLRRKTPLVGNPYSTILAGLRNEARGHEISPQLWRYVRTFDIVTHISKVDAVPEQRLSVRPYYLNAWLSSLRSSST